MAVSLRQQWLGTEQLALPQLVMVVQLVQRVLELQLVRLVQAAHPVQLQLSPALASAGQLPEPAARCPSPCASCE